MQLLKSDKYAAGCWIIGCDDGFAHTKVVLLHVPYGSTTGRIVAQVSAPSRAKIGPQTLASVLGHERLPNEFLTDGTLVSILENASQEASSTQFDEYAFSATNRALIQYTILKTGLLEHFKPEDRIFIRTGLPLNRYYNNNEKNLKVIERKKDSLAIPVTLSPKAQAEFPTTHCFDLKDNEVGAEGLGAWFDYVFDDSCQQKAEGLSELSLAVVDIGGRTTDIIRLLPGAIIPFESTGTEQTGVLSVLQDLKTAIYQTHDFEPTFLEPALQSGFIQKRGEKLPIHDLIEQCVQANAGKIVQGVNQRIGQANEVDRILLVGGGASLFYPALKAQYPHCEILPDPAFCNARGFAKMEFLNRIK